MTSHSSLERHSSATPPAERHSHDAATEAAEAVCIHPHCMNVCVYPTHRRGPVPLFCSRKCALDCGAQRRRLLHELEAIDASGMHVGPRSRDERALTEKRQQVPPGISSATVADIIVISAIDGTWATDEV